jgi:hypothetical protein
LIHALPTRGRIVSPIHNMGRDALRLIRGEFCIMRDKKKDIQFRGRT